MRYLISAALLLTLTACGGSDGGAAPRETPTETATSTAATTQTMRDACPAIEAALPEVDASAEEWTAFIASVDELSAASDLETQNALELLLPGARSAQKIAEQGGLPAEAEMNVSDSVGAFADRCRAAGSSALQ